MAIKFTNFAYSTLAVGIGSGDTTIAVAGGHGARFPTLGVGDYFYATLENSGGTREIIKVTARAVDSLTVVRAQDNTTAVAWLAGDSIALRLNAKAISDQFDSAAQQTGLTGTLLVPSGTTAERANTIGVRYNTTIAGFEGYNGSSWGSIGGGATGGVGDAAFYENDQQIDTDYTLTTGKNAGSFGPITVASGVTVTVPSGATWSIV